MLLEDWKEEIVPLLSSPLQTLDRRRKRSVLCSTSMMSVSRLSGFSPEASRHNSLPDCQGLVSKWKRCVDCEQPLPIPTYFGGSDKEREEIHRLPLGVQQRRFIVSVPYRNSFFFFLSLPLAASCVFVTTLFCSSSTKRSGQVLNRNRSFLRVDTKLCNLGCESMFWSGLFNGLIKQLLDWERGFHGLKLKFYSTIYMDSTWFSLCNVKDGLAHTTFSRLYLVLLNRSYFALE